MGNSQNNNKMEKYSNLFSTGAGLFAIGLIIFLVMLLYENINEEVMMDTNGLYLRCIQSLGNTISNLLMTVGVGSMILEAYNNAEFFRKRISELFTKREMLHYLSRETKAELRLDLLKSIYKPTDKNGEAVLNLFDEKIGSVVAGKYYDRYNMDIKVDVIRNEFGEKYIKKEVLKSIKVRNLNRNKTAEYAQFVSIVCAPINYGKSEPLQINEISVNGNRIEAGEGKGNYKIRSIPFGEKGAYTMEYACDPNIPYMVETELEVSIRYTTIVPYDDRGFSIVIDALSKGLQVSFRYDSEEYKVHANGFKFSTTIESGFKIDENSGMVVIKTDDWVLPGEGVSFTIYEKKPQILNGR